MDFSPEDRAWFDSNPDIKFGSKELGFGGAGIVYELDNNPNLVIKVPKRFIPYTDTEKCKILIQELSYLGCCLKKSKLTTNLKTENYYPYSSCKA